MTPDTPSPTPNRTDRASRRRRRRLVLWIGGGILLIAVLAWAFQPEEVPADFAFVERGPLEVTLDEEGETRVRERYAISAPVAGTVLRIELEPGDEVVGGETLLATFRPAPLDPRTRAEAEGAVGAARAGRDEARVELERARAELAQAETEAERYRELAREQVISRERLDAAELQLVTRRRAVEASEFRLATAEHRVAQARAALSEAGEGGTDTITLTSPVDGVVLSRRRESEGVVPAGEPLLEVGDPAELEIVADFLSSDAVRIDPGDPVHIDQWGGDETLEGTVRRVEPAGFTKISALGVEEQRVDVIVDFADPRAAWEALGDAFRVEVEVVVWSADDVLQVPTSALFRHEGGWAVFTVSSDGDSAARLTPVEIGHRTGLSAEVREGLSEGDRVIVHPSDQVADGVQVEERETD